MGRPLKKGLNYFNIDCVQEDNLNMIEAKHGLVGYGVLIKLWRKIYMIHGYYTEWTDKNIYLFAREIGVDAELINQVVESCFNEGIFHRDLFRKFQILTSRGVQKRYVKIVTEAKRKDCSIDVTHSLLEFPPEETEKTPEESTQRKEKEIKGKETRKKKRDQNFVKKARKKTNTVAREIALPFSENFSPLWKKWKEYQREHFGFEYRSADGEEAALEELKNLSKNDEKSAQEIIRQSMAKGWKGFYEKKQQRNNSTKPPAPNENMDLQYLYERFCEGELDQRLVNAGHFEDLRERGYVTLSNGIVDKRIRSLIGSNNHSESQLWQDYQAGKKSKLVELDEPMLQRMAVIEFFKHMKEANAIKIL
jgi:hypothetical protein